MWVGISIALLVFPSSGATFERSVDRFVGNSVAAARGDRAEILLDHSRGRRKIIEGGLRLAEFGARRYSIFVAVVFLIGKRWAAFSAALWAFISLVCWKPDRAYLYA